MEFGEIEALFLQELLAAEEQHPGWPRDVIHAAAIAFEEKGELLKAAIDFYFGRGSREELIKEAGQLGAMAARFLMHVEDYEQEYEPKVTEEEVKKFCSRGDELEQIEFELIEWFERLGILKRAAEPKERKERIKYLRKNYNMEALENRIQDINAKQHGSIKIEGLNPEEKTKSEQPKTCGECVHFEANGQENYCPFKMTVTEAASGGCGEGEKKD